MPVLVCVSSALHATPEAPRLEAPAIRRIVDVVAHRQLHPLREGDYTPVHTDAAALAARVPEGMAWSYQWGVVLYGALRSTEVTGDVDVANFVVTHNQALARYHHWLTTQPAAVATPRWTEFKTDVTRDPIARLVRSGDLDNTGAMGTEFLESMLRFPDRATPEEREVVSTVADWITHHQERLPDGAFWRPDVAGKNNIWRRNAIWSDDLYMACPFLVRWAQYTGDARFLDDAAQQIIAFAGRLQDADGLWYHGWFEPEKRRSPFKWGRSNGWAMVATVEVLSALPEDHPARAQLLAILRRHIAGVEQVQPSSGVWYQVLDHPELWEETSCTAMFAYSIARAVNRGWIEPRHLQTAQRAFAGLAQYITPEGVVKGTCEGTGIGLTLDYYRDRRRIDDDLHARGVVLLAGTELLASRRRTP